MNKLRLLLLLNLIFLLFIPGCSKQQPAEHIKVVMKKYSIEPDVIRVKSGELVELEVSTADVQHGFNIDDLGIKEPVNRGKPAVFTFKAPAKGEYKITCGIICGPRHDDMRAKLVVE
jgi:cytochrome c oxidase subunit II